jgi:GT2 family glycosyltransferase
MFDQTVPDELPEGQKLDDTAPAQKAPEGAEDRPAPALTAPEETTAAVTTAAQARLAETTPFDEPPAKPKRDRTKFVVSALIVSNNVKPQLLQCLRSFFSIADIPVEAIVVDNASTDGSAAAVTDEFPQVTVLREPANMGYGRAANIGLERCRGRFVLLLSPDVTLDAQTVGRMADFLLTRQDAGAVGPRILMPDGSLDPDARRSFPVPRSLLYRTLGLSRLFPTSSRFGSYNMGHVEESEVHEIDAGTATCLMLRMAALDRIGFFDPRYFMFGEDIDLCYRMKLGGWKVFYVPTAVAMRHETQPTTEVQRQALYEKYRSEWAYHFKHHAEDVSAFGNGLVWAQIWGRWVGQTLKETLTKGRRPRNV